MGRGPLQSSGWPRTPAALLPQPAGASHCSMPPPWLLQFTVPRARGPGQRPAPKVSRLQHRLGLGSPLAASLPHCSWSPHLLPPIPHWLPGQGLGYFRTRGHSLPLQAPGHQLMGMPGCGWGRCRRLLLCVSYPAWRVYLGQCPYLGLWDHRDPHLQAGEPHHPHSLGWGWWTGVRPRSFPATLEGPGLDAYLSWAGMGQAWPLQRPEPLLTCAGDQEGRDGQLAHTRSQLTGSGCCSSTHRERRHSETVSRAFPLSPAADVQRPLLPWEQNMRCLVRLRESLAFTPSRVTCVLSGHQHKG